MPGYWTPDSDIRSALDIISNYELSKNTRTNQNKQCILLVDHLSHHSVKYYLWNHSTLSKKYEHLYSKGELRIITIWELSCSKLIKKLKNKTTDPSIADERVWLLVSSYSSCIKKIRFGYLCWVTHMVIKRTRSCTYIILRYFSPNPITGQIP